MICILPIRTDRLELRRFSRDDLEEFQAYRSDPDLSKYQDWEPTTDKAALAFLDEQSDRKLGPEGQWLQVAVTCIETKRLVGDVGLCVSDTQRSIVKIGFTIARSFQRRGYATEAVRGILGELCDNNEIKTVVAVTDARNEASISTLKRLGFTLRSTNEALFRGLPCTEHTFERKLTRLRRLRNG